MIGAGAALQGRAAQCRQHGVAVAAAGRMLDPDQPFAPRAGGRKAGEQVDIEPAAAGQPVVVDRVDAGPAVQEIAAGPAAQAVFVRAALERVVAAPTVEHVVAAAAVQDIAAAVAAQQVGTAAAGDVLDSVQLVDVDGSRAPPDRRRG